MTVVVDSSETIIAWDLRKSRDIRSALVSSDRIRYVTSMVMRP
jgi:hypothetical protein